MSPGTFLQVGTQAFHCRSEPGLWRVSRVASLTSQTDGVGLGALWVGLCLMARSPGLLVAQWALPGPPHPCLSAGAGGLLWRVQRCPGSQHPGARGEPGPVSATRCSPPRVPWAAPRALTWEGKACSALRKHHEATGLTLGKERERCVESLS